MERSELPVLIVGAGPVGLMAALLLARQGIACRVVERRSGPQRAPAAHVVNGRTLEICRAAGVDMAALAAAWARPEDAGQVLFVTSVAGEELGRLPFERQGDDCLAYTPTPLRNLSQHRFEPILVEALRKSPHVTLDYGHQWEASEQDGGGVTSRIRDLASGAVEPVRSRWLLAADGAGSRVRKALGIDVQGPQRLQSFVMIHFEANLRPLVADRLGALYWICNPEHRGTFVAHDVDREWVYMVFFDPERERETDYTEEVCTRLVRGGLGTDRAEIAIRGVGSWTMTAQVADRLRDGRVFLVGDAAHRFPPTGGLGLNTGIQDVHNLVWKVAFVERGLAPDVLLESFETERKPVAQLNADQSLKNALKLVEIAKALGVVEEPTRQRMEATLADPAGRQRVSEAIANQAEHFDMLGLQLGFVYEHGALVPDGTPKPEAANPVRDYVPSSRPGSRLPHAWVERDGERVSTLDLLAADGFTLVSGGDAAAREAWAAAAAALAETAPLAFVPVGGEVADPEGHWASVSGIGPDGALLVRPDQHVAWRARSLPADPASAVGAALARVLGR